MDKKQAILKSVLKLVNREGFYHLNMKNIAKEAGIAAGGARSQPVGLQQNDCSGI